MPAAQARDDAKGFEIISKQRKLSIVAMMRKMFIKRLLLNLLQVFAPKFWAGACKAVIDSNRASTHNQKAKPLILSCSFGILAQDYLNLLI